MIIINLFLLIGTICMLIFCLLAHTHNVFFRLVPRQTRLQLALAWIAAGWIIASFMVIMTGPDDWGLYSVVLALALALIWALSIIGRNILNALIAKEWQNIAADQARREQ